MDDYGHRIYDLEKNIGETDDLMAKDSIAHIFNMLNGGLENWEKEMEAPRWLEVDAWNEVTFEIHKNQEWIYSC